MRRASAALAAVVVALAAVACTPRPSRAGAGGGAAAGADARADADGAASTAAPAPTPVADVRPADVRPADAGVIEPPPEPEPEPTFDDILPVLFADRASRAPLVAACPASLPPGARVRCLYDERYKGDAKAAGLAHELFVKWHTVAGVEVAHTMNGGYRGMIRIEPAVPVGPNRKHLEWVAGALRDFDAFFGELERSRAGAGRSVLFSAGAQSPKPFRFHPLTLRFMRSVAARTPAAYAHDWTVAYNFVGTLNISADAVRETMFHEVFHLNDAAHGDWSPGALGAIFDAVAKKCGTSIRCLEPYTPNGTIVRGGTYYAFQPGNGVMEYAAELALRYYREQRASLRHLARVRPFKCGPPENARAWSLMRDEFFAGVDAVPPCS